MFGSKKEEVTGGWRKLHNAKDRTCNMQGSDEKRMQNFKSPWKETQT
jgi:hypothetical protein